MLYVKTIRNNKEILNLNPLFQGHKPQDGNAAMTSDLKMESKGTQIHLPLIGRGSRGELNDKVTFSQVKSPPFSEQLNNGQILGWVEIFNITKVVVDTSAFIRVRIAAGCEIIVFFFYSTHIRFIVRY